MKSEIKKFILLAILFSLIAIGFFLLYYFNIINYLSLYLAVTYISYFVGLALLYNGAYSREKDKLASKRLNLLFGILFVLVSIGLLVYGLVTKEIVLF